MFLDEALKIHRETGRKIRPNAHVPFEHPKDKYLRVADYFEANTWEVEPVKVEVTRELIEEVLSRLYSKHGYSWHISVKEDFFKELGI